MKFTSLLIALVVGALPQEEGTPLDPALPGSTPGGAADSDSGAWTVRARRTGLLFVRASTVDEPPSLRVSTLPGEGEPAREAVVDGSGALRVARLHVVEGERLRVEVDAAGDLGPVALEVSLAAETEATAEIAAQVEARLGGLRDADGAAGPEADELLDRLTSAGTVSPRLREAAADLLRLGPGKLSPSQETRAQELVFEFARRHLPSQHPERVDAAALLGYLFHASGRYEDALELQCDVVEARMLAAAPDADAVLEAQINLAGTYFRLGELAEASEIYAHVWSVVQSTRAAREPLFLAARNSYAAALLEEGRVEEAELLLRAQLAELEGRAGVHPVTLARARRDHARALFEFGRLVPARRLLDRAVPALAAALPSESLELARLRVLQARLRLSLGDHLAALGSIEPALEAMQRSLTPTSPDLAGTRRLMAEILIDLGGEPAERGRALLRAQIDSLDEADLARLDGELELGLSLGEDGVLDEAIASFESVRDRLKPVDRDAAMAVPAAETELATTAEECLAWALAEAGRFEEALPLQRRVVAARSAKVLSSDLRRCRAEQNLAWMLACTGAPGAARDALRSALEGHALRLRTSSFRLGAREAELLALQAADGIGEALSVAALVRDAASPAPIEADVFALIESTRCVTARLRRVSDAAVQWEADEEVRSLASRLDRAVANVVRRSRAGGAALVEAVRARDRAERALYEALEARTPSLAQDARFDLAALQAALDADESAVGYWRYPRTEVDPGTGRPAPPVDHYLAYVVGPKGPLVRVELGPAGAVDAAVDRWHAMVGSGTARGLGEADESMPAGGELRRLVLDPVLSHTGDASLIHLALDDSLHLVPLDALPLDGRTYVGDRVRLVVHATLRELVDRTEAARVDEAPALLVVGGLEYDALAPSAGREGGAAPAPLDESSLRAPPFLPLLSSETEVRAIARSFERRFEGGSVRLFTGTKGTRSAFEESVAGARFIHVASHAYFESPTLVSMRDVAGSPATRASALDRILRGMAPSTLCGVAFAGANRIPSAGEEHRLLTAEELARADLASCELAVLSACESGLGVRRAGQGVASLQRALYAAGARSTITSLWDVPDAATSELMRHFYREYWTLGRSKADALWAAKRHLRAAESPAGGAKYPLRAWAGWVLTGASR